LAAALGNASLRG